MDRQDIFHNGIANNFQNPFSPSNRSLNNLDINSQTYDYNNLDN